MKTVRIHKAQDLRVEDVEAPEVEPGKVLLTGGFSGICGSDLHLYYAPEAFPWDFSEPAELTGAQWPQILGHEFSGTVAAVGEGVNNVKVGDDVAVFPYHFCGECPACQSGDPDLCSKIAFEGIQGRTGGMAEIKIVDAGKCYVLPEGASLELGALVEPMAVAYHGVKLSEPDGAKCALVLGGGPIGVGAYFALKSLGVNTIIVSEPSAARREVLARIGVEHLIDPTTQDVPEQVGILSGGAGADVAIDCAGAPVAFPGALQALGMHGRMVIVAAYETPIELDPQLLRGNKTIRISAVYTPADFQGVIDGIAAGNYTAEGGWIDTVPLEQAENAIHQLRQGNGMKILVDTSAQ